MSELLLPPPALPAGPASDPAALLGLAEGMFAIDVLTAAVIRFGAVEALASTSLAIDDWAARTGMTLRAAAVVASLFEALGIIELADGAYLLTPLGREFLLAESPWTIVPVYEALAGRPDCETMASVMSSSYAGLGPELDWAAGMGRLDFARAFMRSTDARNTYLADAVARRMRPVGPTLLDVAGGSGIYSYALLRAYPGLRAVLLEQPPVDELAREAVAEQGMGDRVEVVTGDMFASGLGTDAGPRALYALDNVLMSNVLHDWNLPDVNRLLKAAWRVLRPGGQLVLHDAFLGHGRERDRAVAEYSGLLMKFTSGRCHALADVISALVAIGFTDIEVMQTVVGRDLVVASRPQGGFR
jgi:ubiquinone/menaquinone biosynthesis C-methylase UbiE